MIEPCMTLSLLCILIITYIYIYIRYSYNFLGSGINSPLGGTTDSEVSAEEI